MNQYNYERLLTIFYSIVTCASLISGICGVVAWLHWESSLDKCPYTDWFRHHENCGCILYGKSFDVEFRGGPIAVCHYVTFAPIPILMFLLVFTGYQIIRICVNQEGKPRNNVTMERRDGEVIVIADPQFQSRQSGGSRKVWLTMATICAIFAVYMLVHGSILTDGYFKTCSQYRNQLIKEFSAFGNQQAALHNRLSCSAIYDFMDYLFPDYNNKVRGRLINTTITLSIAMITSWICTICLTFAAIINYQISKFNKI